jgi:hypothetical protein
MRRALPGNVRFHRFLGFVLLRPPNRSGSFLHFSCEALTIAERYADRVGECIQIGAV